MLLYHGTNIKFDTIDLSKSKNKRDFGKGFYTTTIKEQAEEWAQNMFLRYGGDGSFVNIYEYSEDDSLNFKVFNSMSKEWLEFVKYNRTSDKNKNEYDVVKGPVANDNTMRTIALYISGIYTPEQALEKLRYFKVNDQISFHNEKALANLKFIETYEVR